MPDPETQRKIRVMRLNDNLNRVDMDPEAPRRIVILFKLGQIEFAAKVFPAESLRYAREMQVYRELHRARVPHVVKLVGSGTGILPLDGTLESLRIKMEKQVLHIPLTSEQKQKIKDAMTLHLRRHGRTLTESMDVRYILTQVHVGYREWSDWSRELAAFPTAFSHGLAAQVGLKMLQALLRAHLVTGFAHVDLHAHNILVALRYKKKRVGTLSADVPKGAELKDVSVTVRLFDFDISYLPKEPSVPRSKVPRNPLKRQDLHLWYHVGMQQWDVRKRDKFRPYTILHDLVRIVFWFAVRPGGDVKAIVDDWVQRTRTMRRLHAASYAKAMEYATEMALTYRKDIFGVGEGFKQRIQQGQPPLRLHR